MKRYYRFRYYRGFTVSRNSFEARRNSNNYTIEDKSLLLAKPNQWKRSKHPNRTVNPQVLVKTAINSIIAVFFYTIYRALKLQYRPALLERENNYRVSRTLIALYFWAVYIYTYIYFCRLHCTCVAWVCYKVTMLIHVIHSASHCLPLCTTY